MEGLAAAVLVYQEGMTWLANLIEWFRIFHQEDRAVGPRDRIQPPFGPSRYYRVVLWLAPIPKTVLKDAENDILKRMAEISQKELHAKMDAEMFPLAC